MSDHKHMVVSGEKIQRLEEIKNQLLNTINDERTNEESDSGSVGRDWFLIGNQEVLNDIDELIIKEKRNIVRIDYCCSWECFGQELTPETYTIEDHLEERYPEWSGLFGKTTRESVQESMLEIDFSHISKNDREEILELINH